VPVAGRQAGLSQQNFKAGWKVEAENIAVFDSEESKNPAPSSGAGPSTLRGLFHPIANTVIVAHCMIISEILNLS
jgi:hypothetical protein